MGTHGNSDFQDQLASDEEMLNELYRQMLRAARHRLFNQADATDVVQDAWVRILERQETLREADKLIPWARAIAANIASNENRGNRYRRLTDGKLQYYASLGSAPGPDFMAELSDTLGRLDPITRTLLLYKFYYGFKDDEIAAAMQVPVGTVKARIHRSKARLRKQLHDDQLHP